MRTRTWLQYLISGFALAGAASLALGPLRATAEEAKATKPPLEKGMTAETIVALVGKPLEVRPIDSPSGKAEVWTYRRLAKRQVTQSAVTQSMVPTYTGINMFNTSGNGFVPQLEFHLEHIDIYQVTALLLFDGKLVSARQWLEQSRRFES